MRNIAGRRGIRATVVAVVLIMASATAACGDDTVAATTTPADLLLNPSALPRGFTPTESSVAALVAANTSQLASADAASIDPSDCRPTADAALNKELTDTNGAILTAQSADGSVLELVTTLRRDIDADIRATSGRCARTETTIKRGELAGARSVAVYSELPEPDLGSPAGESLEAKLEQIHLVQSLVTTTLTDGGVQSRLGYAGYALVKRPGLPPVTVQLTVAGEATALVTPPTPASEPHAPMSSAEFLSLFGDAIRAAVDPHD